MHKHTFKTIFLLYLPNNAFQAQNKIENYKYFARTRKGKHQEQRDTSLIITELYITGGRAHG